MSDGADDETAADSQQESEQQPADTDQSAAQSEEQPVDQAEEQPAEEGPTADQPSNADQPIEQSQDQAADSDQPADQPTDSSESAASDSKDNAVALAGGGRSPAAGGGGKLRVIAEFTQEGGQKFMGEDIKIIVAEWDNGQQRRFLFPIDPPERQEILKKGNVITTVVLPVTTNEVIIYPEARVRLASSMVSYQNITGAFVFKVPDGTTLQTKFDVTVQPVDKTVKAPDADKAKGMAAPSAKQYASFDLKAEPVGDQQFHVTGKYYNGGLNSPDGRRI
jgi:hypothetical protein